ncbi:hypothetical protein M422DRAFT_274744 [Sphaerobolus stellatus SS14]|uniref:Uncharacterized protein n=1 Tax=Sphaerobolus stellatus (strain SS14) TaxID=990650 RepID=A0A0C9UH14_SPHS4|nr:hypothetical protein M422DRAFT_274744 [Sphaerobolus stellatus SS14]
MRRSTVDTSQDFITPTASIASRLAYAGNDKHKSPEQTAGPIEGLMEEFTRQYEFIQVLSHLEPNGDKDKNIVVSILSRRLDYLPCRVPLARCGLVMTLSILLVNPDP